LLIIFDLDDTLIDTSGSVTPFKLQTVFEILMGRAPTRSELQEFIMLNERCSKTQEAVEAFGRDKKVSRESLAKAMAEMTRPLPTNFSVACTPKAKEILKLYKKRCPIALVTGGHPPFQREKMEKAGIEASTFSKIAIPEDSIKKPFYEGLMREFSEAPADIWVCGDRVSMDLAPAHELGFHTVHMRWGRGARIKHEPWIEYSISDLGELRNIIP
jgi:FMN phosphatase YigB (HAD superfamily)